MTSKKKLRKRIAYLEQELEITQGILRTTRRRWVKGVKPSPIERLLVEDPPSTPVLNTLPRANLTGNVPTKLTWGWSAPAPSAEMTGPVPGPEDGFVVDGNDGDSWPIMDRAMQAAVHEGWLLSPRSEEKRSMEGGTE